jgi:hypothetical protein
MLKSLLPVFFIPFHFYSRIMTDKLNTPEQKEATLAWLREFHASSDALDAKTWVEKYFTNDALVQFASSPIVEAHGRFIEIQDKRLAVLDEMKHE